MPNEKLQERAQALAARPYTLFAFLDKTTSGGMIYVATNPELPGCYAQGDTMQEAEEILAEVREDYIAYLLSRNLSVPEPRYSQEHVEQHGDGPQESFRVIEPKAQKDTRKAELSMEIAFAG